MLAMAESSNALAGAFVPLGRQDVASSDAALASHYDGIALVSYLQDMQRRTLLSPLCKRLGCWPASPSLDSPLCTSCSASISTLASMVASWYLSLLWHACMMPSAVTLLLHRYGGAPTLWPLSLPD